jgi:mono/diheme cytochrome c family protein
MTPQKRPSRRSRPLVSGRLAVLTIAAVLALIVVVVFTFGGGDGATAGAPVDPHTGLSEFDIPIQDPDLVNAGRETFGVTCSACHGPDLRGTTTGPSLLSVIYNPIHHPDELFLAAALNGVAAHHWGYGDMPPVAGLTEAQLLEVVAYVRETQSIEGFEAYPPS